jgi:hypothetical protein
VKIVAMVVREMNFLRRDLGQVIVASAILEGTIGWIIVAMAFGLASAGTIGWGTIGRAVIGTALFLALSFTIGQRMVASLIRWSNDHFQSEFPVITAILIVMITMALTTQLIAVNTVLGGIRRRRSDRRISDLNATYRWAAPRAHHCSLHAGISTLYVTRVSEEAIHGDHINTLAAITSCFS